MKILVFSDTHGNGKGMLDAVQEQAPVDACFFLGDGMQDVEDLREAFPTLVLHTVRGNCDPVCLEPVFGVEVYAGKRIFYTHGHTFRVKSTRDYLCKEAEIKRADIVLYGHTHVPRYELKNGVHLFNPGSQGMPRGSRPSYGVILLERNKETAFKVVYRED